MYAALQLQMAHDYGMQISNTTLNKEIRKIAERNHVNLSQLRNMVTRDAGMSYADYKQQMREQLLITQLLQKEVASRIKITPAEIKHFIQRESELSRAGNLTYHLKDILVALPENPSPEQIQAAKQKGKFYHCKTTERC